MDKDGLKWMMGEWGCFGDPFLDRWKHHPDGKTILFFRTLYSPIIPIMKELAQMDFHIYMEAYMKFHQGIILKTDDGGLKIKQIMEPENKKRRLKRSVFSKEFLEWYGF